MDPWNGGTHFAESGWTALMALSNAPEYPNPPKEYSRIWEDATLVRTEQNRFGKAALEKRRADEVAILYILLSHGAKIDEDDGYGATALHMAVDNEKPKLVRALLQFNANPNTRERVHLDGADNVTPLHSASKSKEIMQLLLDHGADASAKDSTGRTPADWVLLDKQRDFDLVQTPDGPRVQSRKRREGQ